MDKTGLERLLKLTLEDASRDIYDFVSEDVRGQIKSALSTFKKISKGESVSDKRSAELFTELATDLHSLAQDSLREKIGARDSKVGS